MATPTSPPPVKVLLADDDALVRSGFKVLLDLENHITVVGEAGTGAEAVEQARATRPATVLMDIRMPQLDGIEATHEISRIPGLQTSTSSTARTHVSRAMTKLSARDRAQLVVIAYQTGLDTPRP